MINPELEPFLKVWNEAWSVLPQGTTPRERRILFEYIANDMALPRPEGVRTSARFVPSGDHLVTVRIDRHEHGGAQPALVYMHGGAWMQGSPMTHADITMRIAAANRQTVVSVDYALAPEHPFPRAVHECRDTMIWLHRNAAELGVDAGRIAIGGDSAGGNLALVTTLWAIEQGLPLPRLQCLIYPCVDIYANTASRTRFAQGFFLDEESLVWFFERYLPQPGDAMDWRASPVLAWDLLERLPPLCLIAAECDPLVDEGRQLAAHLRAAGIDVEQHEYPGLVHGFITLGGLFPQAGEAIAAMAESIRRHLHVPGPNGG